MTTGQPTLKQAHLQGTQSQHTKANLAKELAFPHTGHTLPFVATQTDRVEARTPYMGFGVIGAGRCYLHLQQHGISCSGLTEFYLAFCCYLQQQFFNWASVPGGLLWKKQINFYLFLSCHFSVINIGLLFINHSYYSKY